MGLFFEPESGRKQVWSCGGGVQSTAIAALIIQGRLPKPDVAFMMDTERENSNTFPYLEKYTKPALAEIGVEIHVVPKSNWTPVDLTSRKGTELLIPAFTTETGSVGKMSNFCSGEWKRDAGNRFLRAMGVEACDLWIGFSIDEMRRAKTDRSKWRRNVFPLIELRMRRNDCLRVVGEAGWPDPPRSSCWMCPNKTDEEWLEMKSQRPADFALAVALDRWIRVEDPDLWLHESCRPIEEIDFAKLVERNAGGEKLFGACASGLCFT